MNKAQKKRYLELLAKSVDDLDGPEAIELHKLTALAVTDGYVPSEEERKNLTPAGDGSGDDRDGDGDADQGMTPEEVKTLIADTVSKSFDDIGLEKETVANIQKSIDGVKTVDAASIQEAIKKAVGGQGASPDAIVKAIEAKLPKDVLSKDDVKSLLDDFKKDMQKNTRSQSKMSFPAEGNYPIEHRSGNLTVAQKQLLNHCLIHAPAEIIGKADGGRGIERPKALTDGITDDQLQDAQRRGMAASKQARHEALYGGKSITTGGAGTGAELINTDLSSDIMNRLYLSSQVAAQLVSSEIEMPTNPFKYPLSTTRPTFYKGSEGGSTTNSDPGTSDLTLDAKKLIGVCEYSYESEEDAIIAILPWMQERMGQGAAFALEDAFINGDDSFAHIDSDVTAANDHRKLFKGFRKLATTVAALQVSFATGGITAANLSGLKKALGKYGIRPSDLMYIAGVSAYNDILQLEETLTADKVGPQNARILTGMAPSIGGVPIVISENMREDLAAGGAYDGTTTTKGSLLLVHKPSFIVGVKRGFTVEMEVDKFKQMNQVIGSFRRAFEPMEAPSANQRFVALAHNFDA